MPQAISTLLTAGKALSEWKGKVSWQRRAAHSRVRRMRDDD
jgi:hypothetical protein